MVEVRKRRAHSFSDMAQNARARRDVLECSVTAVPIQAVRQALEHARVAVDRDAAGAIAAEGIRIRRPAHVVHDQEVEAAVVVVVEPAAGHGPLAAADARPPRHVLEPTVAAIVQQLVLSHAGDEEIDVTVVVVVGRGGPHGIPDTSYACVVGDVRKPHPAVVAIETVGVNGGCFLERRRLRAVREEDVGPAVTVVVEDGKPAGRTFDEVFAGTGGVMVDELQTGRGGDLAQVHGPWRRRRAIG